MPVLESILYTIVDNAIVSLIIGTPIIIAITIYEKIVRWRG